MKNIKQQLAQKVDIIGNYSIPDESNAVEVDNIDIIDLDQTQNQTLSVVPEFAITIMDAKNRIEMLQSFVREMMVPNVDYGLIPKCDKPSLFKSGAEKLCDIFGFSKRVEVLNRIENWETGVFHYEVKISLYNKRTGLIEAEGIGSCNN